MWRKANSCSPLSSEVGRASTTSRSTSPSRPCSTLCSQPPIWRTAADQKVRPSTEPCWARRFCSEGSRSRRAPISPWIDVGIGISAYGCGANPPASSIPVLASMRSVSSRNRGLPPAVLRSRCKRSASASPPVSRSRSIDASLSVKPASLATRWPSSCSNGGRSSSPSGRTLPSTRIGAEEWTSNSMNSNSVGSDQWRSSNTRTRFWEAAKSSNARCRPQCNSPWEMWAAKKVPPGVVGRARRLASAVETGCIWSGSSVGSDSMRRPSPADLIE